MMSQVSGVERTMVIASAVVVVFGLVAYVTDDWSQTFWFSIIAAVLAIVVVFLPRLAPTVKLPVTKGVTLLVLGGVAAAGAIIELVAYLNWFFNHLLQLGTIAFVVALAGTLIMAWVGWTAYSAERGTAGPTTAPPAPPEPPAS